MKFLFISLLILSVLQEVSSQTFRSAFDHSESFRYHGGQGIIPTTNAIVESSYITNISGELHNYENEIMEAYLVMYHATNDMHYLDKFILHSKRLQERRDDNLRNLSLSEVGLPQFIATGCTIQGFSQVNSSSKTWSYLANSTQCIWDVERVLYSGLILFPMAQFVYLMKIEQAGNYELQNYPVPAEAAGSYLGRNNISTYADFADWLEDRINQTIQFHSCNWKYKDNNGHYVSGNSGNVQVYDEGYYHDCSINGQDAFNRDALNMQCAMGKTLALMYRVENLPGGNSFFAADYLHKTRVIAKLFHDELNNSHIGLLNPLP